MSSLLKPWRFELRDGRVTLRIRWIQTVCWVLFTGAVLHLGLAAAVWIRANHFQAANVRFADVALPFRWSRYRAAMGDHYIAAGRQCLASGDVQGGLHHLRVGLSKSPGNLPGRLIFVRCLMSAGRADLAVPVLSAGLHYAHRDPAFLSVALHGLLEQQTPTSVTDQTNALLRSGQLSPPALEVVACAQASAQLLGGDYDGAEQSLRLHHVDATPDGRLLLARLEWARGYHELAIAQLQALTESAPRFDDAQAQLAAWLRQNGHTNAFRRLTLLRRIAHPDNIAARIDELDTASDRRRFHAAVSAIFSDFSGDAAALIALAQYAADRGETALARRVAEHCQAAGLATDLAHLLLAETYLTAHDHRAGLELIRTLRASSQNWSPRHLALLDGLEALALRGLGDVTAARLQVERFLTRADLRAESMITLARRFLDLHATDEARAVLARAVASEPVDQAALTELIALDLTTHRLDTLVDNLRRLVVLRHPSPELLQSAYATLTSDRCLFLPGREEILTALEAALARAPRRTG